MKDEHRSSLKFLLFPLLIGVWLLAFGTWAGFSQLTGAPGIESMWPVILVAGGSLFLLGYLLQPRAFGLVLPGSAAVMLGFFFLFFSFGAVRWESMEVLWPIFPLIGGLAFVCMWTAAFFRYWGLLVPATLGVATGIIGLTLTLTPFGALIGFVGWPLALLATGAALILLSVATLFSRSLRRAFGRG